MITEFKLFLKNSALGRALYGPIGYLYVKFYKDAQRKRAMKKYAYTNLKYIMEISEKENIKVMPIFGTLLGFIREGDFIKHDYDIDLGVLPSMQPSELAQILVEKYGFQFIQGLAYHGQVTEFTVTLHGLSTDFFFLQNHDDVTRTISYYWKSDGGYTDPRQNNVKYVERKQITDLKPLFIKDIKVMVPVDVETELEAIYGKGWRIPDPHFTDKENRKVIHVKDYGYTVTYSDIINNRIPS